MYKFFKNKEAVRVNKIMATRAVYHSPDVQEVEITFVDEGGNRLILQLNPRMVPALVNQLTASYEAINPPIKGSGNIGWQGMD